MYLSLSHHSISQSPKKRNSSKNYSTCKLLLFVYFVINFGTKPERMYIMYRVKRQDDPEKNLQLMAYMCKRVMEDESDQTAVLANISAVINGYMDRINWVGFYIIKKNELVLGPFQGLPACVRIQVGKGVCGTAAYKRETQIVPNVHDFPGHIACDSASNSEIVIPIIKNGEVFGVLDVDSPELNRFGEIENKYLNEICTMLGT